LRSALSWASILRVSNSIAAEMRASVGAAANPSPTTCCAPGRPFSTTKDALVWIGAARRLTKGKTRWSARKPSGGDDAAYVPALAVEELYVRVLCDDALCPRVDVRAVASRADRGADEFGAHRRRVRVAEVGL
jgi:hypothetical protein